MFLVEEVSSVIVVVMLDPWVMDNGYQELS